MSKFGFTSPSRSKTLVCCGLRVHQGGIRQDRIERTYSISEVQRTRRRLFVNPFCRAKPKRRIHQNFLSGDGIIVRTPELTAHNHRVGLHASAAMRCLTDSEQDLLWDRLCPKDCDTHAHFNNHDAEHTRRRRGPPDSFTGNFGVRVHLQARMPQPNLDAAVCGNRGTSSHCVGFSAHQVISPRRPHLTLFQSLVSIVQTPNLFAVTRHRERFEFKRYQGLETNTLAPAVHHNTSALPT